MFEDRTPENLKREALAKISPATGLSAMDGSFADAVIGPVAEQMSDVYKGLDAVISMVFVDESSGGYIDLTGETYCNITRRAGTKAHCDISFTGDAGTVLEAGLVFLTAGGLEYTLMDTVTLDASGAAAGRLEAAEAGAAYNVGAGEIDSMYINPMGLSAFANGAAAGGTDEESDEALFARIDEYRRRPPTSGNGYQYRYWTMEVPGVGEAKVVALKNGPGTVGVVIVDSNLEPPAEEIVQAVQDHFDAVRPIGATPTATAAEALNVTVTAKVVLSSDTTPTIVGEAFKEKLKSYFAGLIRGKFQTVYYRPADDGNYTLLFNRVAALLMTIDGVKNYTTLTVNGGTADVSIPASSVPVLGEVTVT